MTCSSSLFPLSSCGKRSWTTASSTEQKGEKGKPAASLYLYSPVWKTETLPTFLCSRRLGTSQQRMVPSAALEFHVSVPCSQPLSQLLIVGYFLFGAVGMKGKGRVFFPTSGPNCLHVVNSEFPSPIKQASQAWLYLVVSVSHFSAKRL